MNRAQAERLLARVSPALSSLRSKGNLLEDIAWPRTVEQRFFAKRGRELPAPVYEVDRDALTSESRDLARIERSIEGDEPIAVFLRAAARSAVERNALLLALGTKTFGTLSRRIYGSATSRFYGLRTRNVDLADHLLDRLKIHGWDEAVSVPEKPVDARAFARELAARIRAHRPRIQVDVVLDERCTAKVIAGGTRVRIRPDATFARWEAEGLFHHEVETHAFTAQNGALQPRAPFLKAGGPRTTPTQEGLAVFAELWSGNLGTPRLERLAVRVKLVAMAEDGASFIDLYRWLVERGSPERDAFLDAARVCRGGLVTGGAPFTKDACYLAGLLHVYTFLSAFVRGGFRDEVEMLVSGRIALEDIVAVVELRAMGLLERPVHRPTWLERWHTLLPYFAFASFMGAVDLRPVETHYQDLIRLAAAARAPRGRSRRT